MDLTQVSIGIKTFLRDDKLFNTIQAIRDTLPEVQMVIADDGDRTEEKDQIYADLRRDHHVVLDMSFDSGFGMKSNAIARQTFSPYLLVGSDDFDFRPPSVRDGIEKLVDVLDRTDISIASGRVRGPYEFMLEDKGDTIIEHRMVYIPSVITPWYRECDLTVNYSLIKTDILREVKWDDDVKIGGGEHGAFFVDVKRAGYRVAYVPGVEIHEQEGEDSEHYKGYRARGASSDRPCFDRRGIRKYVLGNGKIDYEKKDYSEPITR